MMHGLRPVWEVLRAGAGLLFLLLAAACAGSGGDGAGQSGTANAASTAGAVSVLITDAPTPDFSTINVTVTRIELMNDSGAFTLYEGSATFDLLRLENFSNLFSVSPDVPSGDYDAIRLTLTAIELIERGSGESHFPQLGGNGKLDLKPSQPFRVAPGKALVLEIDMDARKSVHVTSGGGGYRFRPVVFVNVGVEAVSNLVRLRGVVDGIDLVARTFEICRVEEGAGEPSVTTDCARAALDADASVFNPDGGAGSIEDLVAGEVVTVVGALDIVDGSTLLVEVVERDALAAYVTLYGTIRSLPDGDGAFDFELDAGQEATLDPVVSVRLQAGTKVFDASGAEVEAGAIAAGLRAELAGVLVASATDPDTVWAEWVILGEDASASLDVLNGTVLYREWTTIMLATAQGNRCVRVPLDVQVQVITESPSGTVSEPGDLVDIGSGREIDAYGTEGGDGCFEAQSVVVFESVS